MTIGQPVLFSSVDLVGKYLARQPAAEWAVRLVNRYSVAEVLAELQIQGLRSISYDVNDDGSGGTEIPMDAIRH